MIDINDKKFVFTGLQSWDIQIGSNAKDIALQISKKNKVLYINTPLDYKTFYKDDNIAENVKRRSVIKKEISYLNKINDNLYILDIPFPIFPINNLPDGFIFDLFNKLNNKKIYSFVKKVLKDLNFEDHILFIDNDIYRSFYAKEMLNSEFSIYYRRDNLRSPFWQKHAERLEAEICKKSDIVLTNSEELAVFAKQFQNKTYCVGQGVDLSSYSIDIKYEFPDDLKNISKPIIGYAGMLTSKRLDLELLYEIASFFKEVNFVFIGPEDEYFQVHKIHNLKNVYFLGNKDMSKVPEYISNFDICINPQILNDITRGNYPRKIDEYLALGKPVIATKTETMDIFRDYCYICESKEEYMTAINELLNINCSNDEFEAKIKFAHSHSWENSVEKIYSSIMNNYNS